MPRNGSGSFSLVSGNPVVPSTVISTTWANNTLSDIGTAITQSIANDGQTVPVANLPMAGFRHTNVANAQNRNEYAAAGQVQDGALVWLTSVAGADTITASLTPSPSAYAAGQTFRFVAAAANTTTAVTLNINGLGAKSVTKYGATALAIGDIPASAIVEVIYDGTRFQVINGMASGRLMGAPQQFTANGTYTPTTGVRYIIVEVLGGGGGGGGGVATGAGQYSVGAGGAAGGYSVGLITAPASTTVTIGAAGAANSGAAGGNGGQSSFGSLIVCTGGTGGGVSAAGAVAGANAVVGGTVATPGNMKSVVGAWGKSAFAINSVGTGLTGEGGSTPYGVGAPGVVSGGPGVIGTGFGSGGSGAFNIASQGAIPGGAGKAGVVYVYEYA